MAETITTTTGFTQESFDAFLGERDEPGWLIDLRRGAWRKFCESEMPGRSEEEWMRTDIRLLNLDRFGPPVGKTVPWDEKQDTNRGQSHTPLLGEGVALAGSTTTWNGRSVDIQLQAKWADKGVIFGTMDQAVAEHPDLVRRYLFKRAVNPHFDKFSSLHAACWSGGTFVYVPRGVVVDEPFFGYAVLDQDGVDLSHTLVILEEGAEATVLCETGKGGGKEGGLHCGATELLLGPGSNLRYISLQNWDHSVWHFAHEKAVVDRDASLQWTIGALGSRLAKVNQHVTLVGRGASCQVNGTMFTEGNQHLSYHTLQHHAAASCTSDLLYKAALQDKSRTVWRGMIQVDDGAQQTDGYQRNDNLLLSRQARADAIPGLEIKADDVRCTHGSTTGRVDEEMIFYARCRGFTRKEATRMIVTGFFQQIFDRISIESVREALGQAIIRRVREYE